MPLEEKGKKKADEGQIVVGDNVIFSASGNKHNGLRKYEINAFNSEENFFSHKLGSERSERASERMSAAERVSKASSSKQANEQTDERVAQSGPRLDSLLI